VTIGQGIAAEFSKAFAGDAWYGPNMAGWLRELPADAAARKPLPHAHSVWEIVLHMTSWQNEVLDRLKGREPRYPADGDWPPVPEPTPAAWDRARADLESGQLEIARVAAALGTDEIQVTVGNERDAPLGTGVTRGEMLLGLLQHNAYPAAASRRGCWQRQSRRSASSAARASRSTRPRRSSGPPASTCAKDTDPPAGSPTSSACRCSSTRRGISRPGRHRAGEARRAARGGRRGGSLNKPVLSRRTW
jgi:hypothetical protein